MAAAHRSLAAAVLVVVAKLYPPNVPIFPFQPVISSFMCTGIRFGEGKRHRAGPKRKRGLPRASR